MKRANRIEEQAAGWVAHLSRLSVGAEERAAFDRWLAADPKHLAAYERLEAAWRRLDRLQSFGYQETPVPNISPFPGRPPQLTTAAAPSLWEKMKGLARRL